MRSVTYKDVTSQEMSLVGSVDKDYRDALEMLDKEYPGTKLDRNDQGTIKMIRDFHFAKKMVEKSKAEKKERRKGIRNRGFFVLAIIAYIIITTGIGYKLAPLINSSSADVPIARILVGFFLITVAGSMVLAMVVWGIYNLINYIVNGQEQHGYF